MPRSRDSVKIEVAGVIVMLQNVFILTQIFMGIEEKLRSRGGDVSQASCWENSQKQLPSSLVLSISEILSQTRETSLQHLSLKLPSFDVKIS